MSSTRKPDGRHVRGQLRQRAILDAARDLFIAQGYRGTTLEAIIAEAGGSRETIYRALGGKRGLFRAIVAQVGERVADLVVEPGAQNLSPRAALTRFAMELVSFWQSAEGKAINRIVVSEGLEAPEIVDAWYNGGTKLSIEALSQYLDAQRCAGRIGEIDSVTVARQFVMLLIGEMAFPVVARQQLPEALELRIQRCVDLILNAHPTSTSKREEIRQAATDSIDFCTGST